MTDARIQLSNGMLFDLLEPDPDLIDIEVIAHALSFLCRFTGHGSQFYSVAQHCVVVSRLVPAKLALHGLLHDAAEAFIGDVSTPLKALLPEYKEIEVGIELAIAEHFGMELDYETVKHADRVALSTERRDLGLPGNEAYWGDIPSPAPFAIVPLEPGAARMAFLARFVEIKLRPGQGQAPNLHGEPFVGRGQPDPRRFDNNEDVSRRLSEAEVEESKRPWEVVG